MPLRPRASTEDIVRGIGTRALPRVLHGFVAQVRGFAAFAIALALLGIPAGVAAEPALRTAQATTGADRVLEQLSNIENSLVQSRYTPVTRIDPKAGLYEFDCSGMAAWVLRRAAPGAWQGVRARSATGRLVARDFFRTILAISSERPSWSWLRVPRVEDARPGDVVAWLKPPRWNSSVTGHVGFVVSPPSRSERFSNGFLVRFADASRYRHQDDSRALSGTDGFGYGTILLIGHPETGTPIAYGWVGEQSGWISETEIVIGRPRR